MPNSNSAALETIQSDDGGWYYADGMRQLGPFNSATLSDFSELGRITADTLVWREGMLEWMQYRDSDLAKLAIKLSKKPPALPRQPISNLIPWLLAIVPLFGLFIELFIGDQGFDLNLVAVIFAYFAVNTILVFLDKKILTLAGHKSNLNFFSILVIPIYLYKRLSNLKQPLHACWAWVIAFLASIFISDPAILSKLIYLGTGLPLCDNRIVVSLGKTLFGDIPLMKFSGISAINLDDMKETSSDSKKRNCSAIILTNRDTRVSAVYSIEELNSSIYVTLNLVP